MKKLFFIIFILLNFLFIKAQVYIDPNYNGVQIGTIDKPYKKIPNINSNVTYLFKRGTQLDTTNIVIYADNLVLGAYGTGKMPIITGNVSNKHQFDIISNNITIKDLEFIGRDTTCFTVLRTKGIGKALIDNCVFSRSTKGIEIATYRNAVIKNVNISLTSNDGIYAYNVDSLKYENCNIWDINTGWQKDIGGDCIQNESVNSISIDNCFLDHSAPGKFPLICNNYINVNIKNSHLIASGTGIYVGSGKTFNIESSVIEGGSIGLWLHCETLNISNSIFKNINGIAIKDGATRNVLNCSFINVSYAVDGWNINPVNFNKNNIYKFKQAIGAPTKSGSGNNYYLNTLNNIQKYGFGSSSTYLNPLFNDSINYISMEPSIKEVGANIYFTRSAKIESTHLPEDIRIIPDPFKSYKIQIDSFLTLNDLQKTSFLEKFDSLQSINEYQKTLIIQTYEQKINVLQNTINEQKILLKEAYNNFYKSIEYLKTQSEILNKLLPLIK